MAAVCGPVQSNRPGSSLHHPPAGRRRGQSLIELAVALPFLLLLMLGTIDLGRMFFDYIELRNAVREGAAYGSRNPTDAAGVRTRIWEHGDFVAAATIDGPTFISDAAGGCFEPGGSGRIQVGATQVFTPITTSFLDDWGLGSATLTSSATMRCLN